MASRLQMASSIQSGNPFISKQLESNRQTQDAWVRFARHRERVHNLLMKAALAEGGSLCVLGAGNCNDIDLSRLQTTFREIHLVDLDRAAMEAGVARQQAFDASRMRLHAPHDLTGVIDELRWDSSVERLIERVRNHRLELEGCPFDLVLSAGVLTQMLQTVEDAKLEPGGTLRLVLELRRQHIRLLLDLTRAGGACILVTDVVSTATAPDLADLREDQLGQRLVGLIHARNFFTATNPVAIWKELTENPAVAASIDDLAFHDPWLWPITKSHSYLTYALTVRKASF